MISRSRRRRLLHLSDSLHHSFRLPLLPALLWLGTLGAFEPAVLRAATGVAVRGFEEYDTQIPALLARWDIPGATIAVALNGRIAFARGYGLADIATQRAMQPDTRGRIGSVSKVITASAILKLVDQGRLSLTDRVFPLLGWSTPTYNGAARDPRLDQITVAEILSHTAGWNSATAVIPFSGGLIGFQPGYLQRDTALVLGLPPPASAEEICRAMVGQPLQTTPGTAYAYSNIGFMILGRVIEHVTGQPYEQAVRGLLADSGLTELRLGGSRESELGPDEMRYYDYAGAPLMQSQFTTDVQFVPEPYAYSLQTWDATGGWTLSAIEGVRLLLALEANGSTPRLLSPASVGAMRTEQFPGSGYGYGWVASNAPISPDGGHNGGMAGTFAAALRSPDGTRHTFIIFNRRPANVDGFVADVLPLLHSAAAGITAPGHDFTLSTLDWEAWSRRTFGQASVEPLDDADQDGVVNLIEYAAGLDPLHPDPTPPASIGYDTDGTPVVTYRRLPLEEPLSWSVECTSDGLTWLTSAAAAAVYVNSDGTLLCAVRVPGSAKARLRVHSAQSEAVIELVLHAARSSRVTNLSARAQIQGGDNVLIAGFVITGGEPRTVMIRGAGPALAAAGVSGSLSHAMVSLFRGNTLIAANGGWSENAAPISAAADRVGAFPFPDGSNDAALIATLAPGAYSAQVSGVAGAMGTGLVEIYEVDHGASHLLNVSGRARVGGDSGELIAGLVITGDSPRRILVRGCGPSLRNFGVTDALAAPLLRLVNQADRREVVRNSGWDADSASNEALRTTMQQAGAFAFADHSGDAAAVVTLSPGAYTLIIGSATDRAGIALAEVYELP